MLTFENAFVASGFIITAYVLYHLIFDRDIHDEIDEQIDSEENVPKDDKNDYLINDIKNTDKESINIEPPVQPDPQLPAQTEYEPAVEPAYEPEIQPENGAKMDIPPNGDKQALHEIDTCDDTSVEVEENTDERPTFLVMSPNYIYRFHKNPRPLFDGTLTPENESMTSSEKTRIKEDILSTMSDPFPPGSSAPVVSSEEARYIPVQYSGLRKKRRCGRLRDCFRYFTFSRDCLPLFSCCKKGEK